MAQQHPDLYSIIKDIMSKEQMSFIKQHIDSVELEKTKLRIDLRLTIWI